MYISRSNLSSVALEPKHRKSKIQFQQKKQTNRNGSQIRRQGPILSAILFKAFRIFSVFEFYQMQQIYIKHCQINFMSDKSYNWTGEYPRGPMFHQQRYTPSFFKIQNYQSFVLPSHFVFFLEKKNILFISFNTTE